MASISRRGSSWWARIRCDGQSLSRTFDTKEDAEKWVATEEARVWKALGVGVAETNKYAHWPVGKQVYFPLPAPVEMTQEPPTSRAKSIDLYIFQNAIGIIKIGRAACPGTRRAGLENASGIPIYLVAVIPNAGGIERSLHTKFSAYRGIGEWFANDAKFRADLSKTLGIPLTFPVDCVLMEQEAA